MTQQNQGPGYQGQYGVDAAGRGRGRTPSRQRRFRQQQQQVHQQMQQTEAPPAPAPRAEPAPPARARKTWRTQALGPGDAARLDPAALNDGVYLARRHARELLKYPGGDTRVFVGWVAVIGDPPTWSRTAEPLLSRRYYFPQEVALWLVGPTGEVLPGTPGKIDKAPEVLSVLYDVRHMGGPHVVATGPPSMHHSVTAFPDGRPDSGTLAFCPESEGVMMSASQWALAQMVKLAGGFDAQDLLAPPVWPRLAAMVRRGVGPDGQDLVPEVVPPGEAGGDAEVVLDFGPVEGPSGRSLEPFELVPGLPPWRVLPGFVAAFGARLGDVTAAAVV